MWPGERDVTGLDLRVFDQFEPFAQVAHPAYEIPDEAADEEARYPADTPTDGHAGDGVESRQNPASAHASMLSGLVRASTSRWK